MLDVLPFLIMAVAAVAAVVAGPGAGLLPLLSLGPAFAAVSSGLGKTTVVGVVALALCAVLVRQLRQAKWQVAVGRLHVLHRRAAGQQRCGMPAIQQFDF